MAPQTVTRPSDDFDTVLVVDFGAQYAQLIARRVREAHVYSEIVPRDMPVTEMLARRPAGIIFSGGPASVHVEGAPSIDPAVYAADVPVLGICYGASSWPSSSAGWWPAPTWPSTAAPRST